MIKSPIKSYQKGWEFDRIENQSNFKDTLKVRLTL